MTEADVAASSLDHFWAVIPAGGAGTRLWPLSRAAAPKFLHDLTGSGRTLIQATVDRLVPLVAERVLVVTGASHRDAVVAQLPEVDEAGVVGEPSPRDSMAAIGLAAAMLELRDPDAVMGSFAADHVITDPQTFRAVVTRAAAAAREGWLVTIGIEPTHPATGFGYIAVGDPLPGLDETFAVREFVEKPAADVAARYVEDGYRWNAGMFVARPGVILDLLAGEDPDFARALRGIAAAPETLEEAWSTLPRIAVDHAVAEPAAAAGRVAVVPGSFGWDDIGDFASLETLLRSAGGLTVLGDPELVRTLDASGLVVPSAGRVVAVVGLEDVVVVDTGDALLVTTRERAQDVKAVVAALKEGAHHGLT
ncbi:mannose-1-phosphate guanylyltransferase [Nocardioides gansuensis]|uniref:Mannose-1-phosphate guanylyltransferase n=1 Tax=Nocardioides gansuensis TaxID=2138300 RepID=A0A2T8FBK7_9ACTN|nr:mannose-1-phosphate guanylyltransferase [Nocardioides gansuensis]PVG83091.1 mannose-1-phosphate guanylyltransferase [Nocardioides gansuensis]